MNKPSRAGKIYGTAFCVALLGCAAFLFLSSWQPPVDAHAFRQSQTGVSAFWLKSGSRSGLLNYETPLFGHPWRVPFEFPLYQAATATLSDLSGKSIARCGRLLSSLFWLLTLVPFYLLCRDLGFGTRYFYIAAVFLLCSPLYLYFSRCILIESTAIFFGFVFLWFAVQGGATGHLRWWILAFAAGALCALVKITTFPSFGLAAAGCLFLLNDRESDEQKQFGLIKSLMVLAILGLSIAATAIGWTHYCDTIKAANPLTACLTSSRLYGWNFGTWAQRVSGETWGNLFANRLVPGLFGGSWTLGLFAAALPFCRGKAIWTIVFLGALFLLPMILFTNLHFVHDYYQYANGFWLIMAFAIAISRWSDLVPGWAGGSVIACVTATQLLCFHAGYYQKTKGDASPAKTAGEELRRELRPEEAILVIGDDWSPEIAFFSERRCIYIPRWMNAGAVNKILQSLDKAPEEVLGAEKLGAILVNTSSKPLESYVSREVLAEYLSAHYPQPDREVGPYAFYSPKGQ